MALEIMQLIHKKSGREDKRNQKTGGTNRKQDGGLKHNHTDKNMTCK